MIKIEFHSYLSLGPIANQSQLNPRFNWNHWSWHWDLVYLAMKEWPIRNMRLSEAMPYLGRNDSLFRLLNQSARRDVP